MSDRRCELALVVDAERLDSRFGLPRRISLGLHHTMGSEFACFTSGLAPAVAVLFGLVARVPKRVHLLLQTGDLLQYPLDVLAKVLVSADHIPCDFADLQLKNPPGFVLNVRGDESAQELLVGDDRRDE